MYDVAWFAIGLQNLGPSNLSNHWKVRQAVCFVNCAQIDLLIVYIDAQYQCDRLWTVSQTESPLGETIRLCKAYGRGAE